MHHHLSGVDIPQTVTCVFKMLKYNLPEVDAKTLKSLAAKFPLTGGQIENVARRWMTDRMLSANVSGERLRELIHQELSLADSRLGEIKKIGFYNN